MDDKRTVIERLDDIENKMPSFNNQEPRPISDVIGRPFADYLKDATLYGVEEDERKFKREIKKQRTTPLILLSILALILVFDIVALIVNKQSEWLLIIITIAVMICPLLFLITLSKQKCKQPMHSFWNLKNMEFYLAKDGDHKKIVKEETRGGIFYTLLIIRIVSSVLCVALGIIYLFGYQSSNNEALSLIGVVLAYLTLLLNIVSLKVGRTYYYFNYIIETEDSYVTYPNLDYFKK